MTRPPRISPLSPTPPFSHSDEEPPQQPLEFPGRRQVGARSLRREEQRLGHLRPHDAHPRPQRPHRRSEEHTSELQSPCNLVCRLLLEKKKNTNTSDVFTSCK